MTKVSVVVPIYNQLKVTLDCLRDLIRTTGDVEIIAVDDGSKREPVSKTISKLFPDIKLLTNETNLGFAKTINRGIREASGNYVVLLNNDIRLQNPNWINIMLSSMDNRSLDLAAPAGGRMTKDWQYIPGEAKKANEEFSYLVGWCLVVKKEVLNKIGLMPEDFGKGFWEDVLFSYRAKQAGFKLGIVENTGVQHLYHTTFKAEGYNLAQEYAEKRKIFLNIIKEDR